MTVQATALQGSRTVRKVLSLTRQVMNPAFSAYRLSPQQLRMDPYLAVDHFYMAQPTFPPHPHAGFSAVTYLLEDSAGSVLNRDSNGDRTLIRPGDLHWTTAASGIVHEEAPAQPGVMCHGLQIFANLDVNSQAAKARADHLNAADVPVVHAPGGARIKVLAGSSNGVSSPIKLLTPMTLLSVEVPPGAAFRHELPPDHNATVMMLDGEAAWGPAGVRVATEQACDFEGDGNALACVGGSQGVGAKFVVFAGRPLNQPVIWKGSFCGSSEQQVAGFVMAYRSGQMGQLRPE